MKSSTLIGASMALALLATPALAQSAAPPAWPGDAPAQQRAPAGAWPGEAPPQQQQRQVAPMQPMMPGPGMGFGAPQPQQEPPCVKEFMALRGDVEKKAQALQAASKRKATPIEACPLFNVFVAAETKLVKFAEEKAAACGIPTDALGQLRQNHKQSTEIRTKVCEVAQQMKNRPQGPSLSDALGTSRVPDASNIKRGGGTFDTLTGTPLGGAR